MSKNTVSEIMNTEAKINNITTGQNNSFKKKIAISSLLKSLFINVKLFAE